TPRALGSEARAYAKLLWRGGGARDPAPPLRLLDLPEGLTSVHALSRRQQAACAGVGTATALSACVSFSLPTAFRLPLSGGAGGGRVVRRRGAAHRARREKLLAPALSARLPGHAGAQGRTAYSVPGAGTHRRGPGSHRCTAG